MNVKTNSQDNLGLIEHLTYISTSICNENELAYMMERRPNVCRKEKLFESGNPDRNTPLSTIAKLMGGTNVCTSSSSSDDALTTTQLDVTIGKPESDSMNDDPPELITSTFFLLLKMEEDRERKRDV